MYFKNREEAGRELAKQLRPYRTKNTAVISLSTGGIIVAKEIARMLHSSLTMLLTEELKLPGELSPLAIVNQDGSFTYNSDLSSGEIEEYEGEYHNFIEEEKRKKFYLLNKLSGKANLTYNDLLYHHAVILVSDGLLNGLSLDAASQILKPIQLEKLVVAVPFATVKAFDRMHLFADDIVCMDVYEDLMDINHYYEDNTLPSREEVLNMIDKISLSWDQPDTT